VAGCEILAIQTVREAAETTITIDRFQLAGSADVPKDQFASTLCADNCHRNSKSASHDDDRSGIKAFNSMRALSFNQDGSLLAIGGDD